MISERGPRAPTTLVIDAADRTLEVREMKSGYRRAVGTLLAKAQTVDQQWPCGIGCARPNPWNP